MSTEDTITEFAPALRTDAQRKAFRLALQVLGDLVGLGVDYFNTDDVGYVKTATEASSDNSALMRKIRKNENSLQGALADVSRPVMACARRMGTELPEEGDVSVIYDDSIVQDTASEKQQDMAEVAAGLMTREEYQRRWYGDAAGPAGGRGGSKGSSRLLRYGWRRCKTAGLKIANAWKYIPLAKNLQIGGVDAMNRHRPHHMTIGLAGGRACEGVSKITLVWARHGFLQEKKPCRLEVNVTFGPPFFYTRS